MDYLSEVERLLDMSSEGKREVMRELRSHHQETLDRLLASGLDAAQAQQEAARQLGDPKETALRLNPVHGRPGWWSVILATVPFLMALALRRGGLVALLTSNRQVQIGILVVAGVYAAIVLREFIAGRRPMWLATWLAAGIGFGYALLALSALLSTAPSGRLPFRLEYVVWLSPLVVLPVCWRDPKWRMAALVVSALIVPGLVLTSAFGWSSALCGYAALASLLAQLAAWFVVGMRLFGAHRFGHPALASLFAYTYFLIGLPLQFQMIFHGAQLAMWDSDTFGKLGMALAALAVLAFGRERSWRARLAWLVGGIFAWAVAWGFQAGRFSLVSPVVMTYAAIASLVVVIVPLVMMRKAQVDRPEIVR